MQSEPILTKFPHRTAVQRDHQWQISFPLNGKPPRSGLWNYKIGFDTEVVSRFPVTPVRGAPTDHKFRLNTDPQCDFLPIGMPSAFLLREQRTSYPRLLFKTDKWTAFLWNGILPEQLWIRHADCHTLFFVLEGNGSMATDFGLMKFQEHDFISIPRGATYFCSPETAVSVRMLMFESQKPLFRPNHPWIPNYPYDFGAICPALPVSYWNHARLFSPDGQEPSETRVFLRHHHYATNSYLVYPIPYFEAVAWQGSVYPFVLSRNNIRTLSSADFHLDPPAYTVFATEDLSLSFQLFLPRWTHSLPYQHINDCTEVLFNIAGYNARPGLPDGTATVHPPGFFHGPAFNVANTERSRTRNPKGEWRDEIALLVESKSPVHRGTTLHAIEGYPESWYEQFRELKD